MEAFLFTAGKVGKIFKIFNLQSIIQPLTHQITFYFYPHESHSFRQSQEPRKLIAAKLHPAGGGYARGYSYHPREMGKGVG